MAESLSREDYSDTEDLGRQPEKGEWAYTTQEGGRWKKGPDLPPGPVTRELVLGMWSDDNRRKEKDGKYYVDLSAVAPYMERVNALHTPDGTIFDVTYEVINSLKPGTPINEEVR